jgi:hypothetical protein
MADQVETTSAWQKSDSARSLRSRRFEGRLARFSEAITPSHGRKNACSAFYEVENVDANFHFFCRACSWAPKRFGQPDKKARLQAWLFTEASTSATLGSTVGALEFLHVGD